MNNATTCSPLSFGQVAGCAPLQKRAVARQTRKFAGLCETRSRHGGLWTPGTGTHWSLFATEQDGYCAAMAYASSPGSVMGTRCKHWPNGSGDANSFERGGWMADSEKTAWGDPMHCLVAYADGLL